MRLLIPEGSRLLELDEVRSLVGPFSESELIYPWKHEDPQVDDLYERVQAAIRDGLREKGSRRAIFTRVRAAIRALAGINPACAWSDAPLISRAAIPYLTEPWYC